MTWASRLIGLFPALILSAALSFLLLFLARPGLWPLAGLLFALYAAPLLAFRIHSWALPLREGPSELIGGQYSRWWGGHMIQWVYIGLPFLELPLRAVPGLYSAWLRLWGAKIGRGVYWTPLIEITDRNLLEVGDFVVFGHQVGLYAHAIKPRGQGLMLYVRRIRIGSGVFIGAGSRLGPGVRVADGAFVPVTSDIYPNTRFPASKDAAEPETRGEAEGHA